MQTKTSNLIVPEHPVLSHNLTVLRDKNSSSEEFRSALKRIFQVVFYEATKNISLDEVEVETPIAKTKGKIYSKNGNIVLAPILRAGVGLEDEAMRIFPQAIVAHLGMFRDEETMKPVWYYNKCHKIKFKTENSSVFILDPMLATGNTSIEAIKNFIKLGFKEKDINLVTIISCPEGVTNVTEKFPDINIFTGVVDECLNENSYIVPGLGDAGDRIYNAK